MRRAFLGNGHRTGIEIKVVAVVGAFGHVRVPMEQDVTLLQGRKLALVVHVSVCDVDHPSANVKNGVVGKHGKLQHHLVHLGVTVAAHAKQLLLARVEHGDHLFGCILARQIVARSVVQNIAQQKELFCPLALKRRKHLLAIICRAVNIGCNHQFHFLSSFHIKGEHSAERSPTC